MQLFFRISLGTLSFKFGLSRQIPRRRPKAVTRRGRKPLRLARPLHNRKYSVPGGRGTPPTLSYREQHGDGTPPSRDSSNTQYNNDVLDRNPRRSRTCAHVVIVRPRYRRAVGQPAGPFEPNVSPPPVSNHNNAHAAPRPGAVQ